MRKIYTICYAIIMTIFLVFPSCSASSGQDIFFSGDIILSLDDSYDAGSEISTIIVAKNLEDFPIAGAYLVIDIVEGEKDPYYPSQLSDSDNIIHEERIEDINLDTLSGKGVSYTYRLPDDLRSGTYRMDVYLRTEKTPIVGIPHIFLPSRHATFTVKGSGIEPSVKILRTTTHIEGYIGPVGAPIDPSSEVTGEVYISSSSSITETLDLIVSVCHWDDTTEDNCVLEKSFAFSIAPHKTRSVPISFQSPSDPDAYSVRLEVKDKSGNTRSLYRSRLIVKGPTSKIRKLYADSKYYEAGSDVTVSALVSGSPDHYTYPEVKGATLSITATDKERNTRIFETADPLPAFTNDTNFYGNDYSFITHYTLGLFEICAEIISESGAVYDSHCVEYDSSKFVSDTREYYIDNKEENPEGTFRFDLCASDPSGMPISASLNIDIFNSQMSGTYLSSQASFTGCHSLEFNADQGSLCTLVINDLETRRQKTMTLDLSTFQDIESADEESDPPQSSGLGILLPMFVIILILSIVLLAKRRCDRHAP